MAVVCIDPGPCFISLQNDPTLSSINVQLEVSHAKNDNKNLFAEKAIYELEDEISRQQPNSNASATEHTTDFVSDAAAGMRGRQKPPQHQRCCVRT